jgi:hypothetical protein
LSTGCGPGYRERKGLFHFASTAEPCSHISDEYAQTSGKKCDRCVFVRWRRSQRRLVSGSRHIYLFTGPVYVIHNDSITCMRLVGMSKVPVTLSNGRQTYVPEGAVARGMVINDSHLQVRVEEIPYYKSGIGPLSRHSISIEPFSVARVDATIDYFGPNDPPPRTLTVSRHQSAGIRYWVTW